MNPPEKILLKCSSLRRKMCICDQIFVKIPITAKHPEVKIQVPPP